MKFLDNPLLHREKILCIDTETTGLNADDEIIQLSMLDGFCNVLFEALIRPDYHETWPEAMQFNRITPEDVCDRPPLSFYKNRIESILQEYEVIIGYNIEFDIRMLKQNCIDIPKEKIIVDVMKEYCEYTGGPRVNLKKCAKSFGFCPTDENFHNSKFDCIATVFSHLQMYGNKFADLGYYELSDDHQTQDR